jgi:hypothetical protein
MKCFLLSVSLIITVAFTVAQAQSEKSASKTIKLDAIQVTEPMIAVNPADPNNFITVFSNWHYSDSRKPASSRTTDGGISWISTEVSDNLLTGIDQADPTISFDLNGNAYYCYLDLGVGHNHVIVAKSINKGATWTSTFRAYDDQNPLSLLCLYR